MNVIGLILARAGSVRLKGKHMRTLGNKKLIEWTFKLSLSKKIKINEFILSTDDEKILDLSRLYKINNFGLRPNYLSGSNVSSYLSSKHAINIYEKRRKKIDIVVLLQPTSPFRSISQINSALNLFIENKKKYSVVSVCKRNNLQKINGNFYITSPKILLAKKSFVPKKFIPINLNKKYSIDIDTINDLNHAKKIINE